jgi:hypothetical protein
MTSSEQEFEYGEDQTWLGMTAGWSRTPTVDGMSRRRTPHGAVLITPPRATLFPEPATSVTTQAAVS